MGYNPYNGERKLKLFKARMIERIKNSQPALAAGIDSVKLDWYSIRNATEMDGSPGDTTEVFIYDEIGGLCGIDANEFVQDIQAITTPNITVRINSPGGSLFDGIAIYNALARHRSKVTSRVDGIAASAASIIAMAGDVEMGIGSQLMIHDAMGVEMGNAREFREMADFLDKQSDNIANVYAAKSGNPDVGYWRNLMLEETWMFANEAVNTFHLADSVYTKPPAELSAEQDEKPDDSPKKESEDDQPEEDDDAAKALEAMMHFDHIANGATRRYKHTSRNFAPAPTHNAMSALAATW